MKTIHDEMRAEVKVAFAFAEDGAMLSAARIFRQIADTYQERGERINRELNELVKK